MFRDLRYGVRMLLRNPGFTLIAFLTLSLGIGANTVIFSIVKSVLIQPLPFAQPDRLMQARYQLKQDIPQEFLLNLINRRDLVDWRTRSRSFERIGEHRTDVAFFVNVGLERDSLLGAIDRREHGRKRLIAIGKNDVRIV